MAPLKSKFISTVAGAGLAVSGMLGMANSAYADDSNLTGKPATSQQSSLLEQQVAMATENLPASHEQIQVPISDARHIGNKGIIFAAVQASGQGHVTLVVYGQDQEVFDATYKASQRLLGDLFPVRGIIVGPTDKPASIDIYINADGHYRVKNEYIRNHAAIIEAVADGYKETVGIAPKENPDNPLLSQIIEPAPSLAQN